MTTTRAESEPVIERINDTPVLRLRDRLLPLVNLNDLLALGDNRSNDDTGAYIVVAQVGASSLGIIVDRVFDTEEIVVKPVAPILRHVTMFSGNTILGDGSVIMILDPNGIARGTGIGAGGDEQGDVVQRASIPGALERSHRDAAVPRRQRAEAGGAAGPGRAAGGHSARQDRNLVRRAGHAVSRQADAAGGALRTTSTPRSRASPCWCSTTATAAWA